MSLIHQQEKRYHIIYKIIISYLHKIYCYNVHFHQNTHNWHSISHKIEAIIHHQTYLTNPIMHQKKSHNAPFCNRDVHTCAFLLQNGALWDMGLAHCGIWQCWPNYALNQGHCDQTITHISISEDRNSADLTIGGRFKNSYKLLNLRALQLSSLNKNTHISMYGYLSNYIKNILPINWRYDFYAMQKF